MAAKVLPHVKVEKNAKDQAVFTEAVLYRILRTDPELKGRITWFNGPFWDGEPVTDANYVELRIYLFNKYNFNKDIPSGAFKACFDAVATKNIRSPVSDYLSGLTWDGVDRFPALARNMGTDAEYAYLMRRWCISAVARAVEPGCQVDTCVLLVGPQGYGKSRLLEALAVNRGWYMDTPLPKNKDAYAALAKKWIVELAELEVTVAQHGIERLKGLLSSAVDTYRKSYGQVDQDYPRTCVFAASTNTHLPLTDPTGSRRFWTVPVRRPVSLSNVREMVGQVWAQATHYYLSEEQWWLTDAEVATNTETSKAFDLYSDLRALAETCDSITWEDAQDAGGDLSNQKISTFLRAQGFKSQRIQENGERSSRWVRIAD